MVSTLRVNANHGHDFLDKEKNFTMVETFSAFPFSLQLMFDQTLINLTVFQMI